MDDQQQKYRPCSPTWDFWLALLQVRNYLFADPVFKHFVLTHFDHKISLAADFWIVDKWLDVALLAEQERRLGQ